MTGPTYVPAVDHDGDELWIAPNGWMQCHGPGDVDPDDAQTEGWRRLYVREEPAALDAAYALLDEADTLIDKDTRVDELVALLTAETGDDLRDCHPVVDLSHWDRDASFAIARPGVTR